MIDREIPLCPFVTDEPEAHYLSVEVPEGIVERAASYLNITAESDLTVMRRNYLGEFEDRASWAASVLADYFAPAENDPPFERRRKQFVERYFDYQAFARDEELNGHVIFYPECDTVHVFAKVWPAMPAPGGETPGALPTQIR